MVLTWRCSDCGLTNSVQRNKCQACFADISTGITPSVQIKDEKEHDLLLCGFVRQMTTHFVPDDIMAICRSFYPSTVTIHVGSFVGNIGPEEESYIKIPELYQERNLFKPNMRIRWGCGFVVLENRFGTILETFGVDVPDQGIFSFLDSLRKDCILIMAIQDSGVPSFITDSALKKYADIGVSENRESSWETWSRQGIMFVGSTNGIREWSFYKSHDSFRSDERLSLEQVFTVPLLS